MITVYSVLKESGVKFTHKDCGSIGEIVGEAIIEKPSFKAESIEVYEGVEKTYYVRPYPNSARTIIEDIAIKYFGTLK